MTGNRTLKIEILGDAKSGQKAFGDLGKSADSFASKIGSAFGKVATIAGGIIVAHGLMKLPGLFSNVINSASDLNESLTKNQVLFGDFSKQIEAFSKTTATSFGISRNEALAATGVFGNLFRAMEIGQGPAAGMSTKLVGLAGDLASFNNADPSQVLDALRSGLVGETEPLRQFGVNINQAAINQEALNLGLSDGKATLTAAQKAQATYSLILKQTSLAQGDFARTSTGLANAQRIIKAEFADIAAQVGTVVLPMLATLTSWFAGVLPRGVEIATTFLRNLRDEVRGPFTYAWDLARDAVLTFIQAFQGDWANSDKIRPLHQVFGALGTTLGAVASIFDLIAKGKFDEVFRKLFSAVKLDLGVISRLGKDLALFLVNGVKGLGAQIAGKIADELGSIDWAALPGQAKAFGLRFLEWIKGQIKSLSWADVVTIIMGGIGTRLLFGNGLGAGAINIGTQIYNWIKDKVTEIDWSGVAGDIQTGIGDALSFVGGIATSAVDIGGQIYGWIKGKITGVDWSGIAGDIQAKIGEGFGLVKEGAQGAVDIGAQIFNWIHDKITAVDWSSIADTIRTKIGEGFSVVKEGAQGAVDIGTRIYDWIKDKITNTDWSGIGATIQQKITDALQTGGTGQSEDPGGFSGLADTIRTKVLTAFQQLVDIMGTQIPHTFKIVEEQMPTYIQTWENLRAAILGVIASVSLGGFISMPGIVKAVFGQFDLIILGTSQYLDLFNTAIGVIVKLVQGDWTGAMQVMSDSSERMRQRVISAFKGFGIDIGNVYAGAIQKGKDWAEAVGTAAGSVVTTISGLPGTIQGYFVDAGTWLYNSGAAILGGLLDGIRAGWQPVADFLDWVTGQIPIHKGPMSKDLKLLVPTGRAIMQGLADGLDETDAVIASAESATNDIVNAIIQGVIKAKWDVPIQTLTEDMIGSILAAQNQAAKALSLAKLAGADEEQLATLRGNLDAATLLVTRWQRDNGETVQEYMDKAVNAAALANSHDMIVQGWQTTFGDIDSILDGTLIPQLEKRLLKLRQDLNLAKSVSASPEAQQAIQDQINTIRLELIQAETVMKKATEQGIVKPIETAISEGNFAALKQLAQSMADKGASLVDGVVSALEAGRLKLSQAAQILPDTVIPKIQDVIASLQVDLAAALENGTDPSKIKANIAMILQLLAQLKQSAASSATAFGTYVEGLGYYQAPGVYTNVNPVGNRNASTGGSPVGGGPNSRNQLGIANHPYAYDANGNPIYMTDKQLGIQPESGGTHVTVNVDGQVVHQSVTNARQKAYNARISPFGSTP